MSTTSANTTHVTADRDVPVIRIVREFDAPPAQVFRAHTEPELLARWFGPHGTETRFDHWDCRAGGSYRYVHRSNGMEFVMRGSFHEVRAPELIVRTAAPEGEGDDVALERLVFEDLGDGRTRLTTSLLVDSFEARDGIIATGMEHGVREGYDRLEELLAG